MQATLAPPSADYFTKTFPVSSCFSGYLTALATVPAVSRRWFGPDYRANALKHNGPAKRDPSGSMSGSGLSAPDSGSSAAGLPPPGPGALLLSVHWTAHAFRISAPVAGPRR